MKGYFKFMLSVLLTALLLLCGTNTGYAQKKSTKQQKSLVTQSMAHKIASLALNNRGSIRTIFHNANNIKSISEANAILYSIDEHPECVENFIVALFKMYGTGNSGFLAFDDCGFTPAEYDIAKKIYNNIQTKEKQKEISLEQTTYNKYIKDGFPNDVAREPYYKPEKFSINEKSLAKYIDELGFREASINSTYDVIVDKNGVMIVTPNDELIKATQFKMTSAPRLEFKNIGKTLYVPSKYELKLVETKEKALSDKIVKIVWDKRTQQWNLADHNEFKNETGTNIYRSVTGDLLYTLNAMSELKNSKKKKHTISVTAYIDGTISCFLDGKELGARILRPYIFIKVVD